MNRLFSKRKNNCMRNIVLSFVLICSAICVQAGDIKYPAKAIPEKLLKNAHVVKRMEEVYFELSDLNDVIIRRKIALTILDEKGDGEAPMVVGYDKLRKVTSFEGSLFDGNGNLLKKLKNKDIMDLSAIQDISLFDDNRMKVYDFNYRTYPYTVEYEVVTKMNNSY